MPDQSDPTFRHLIYSPADTNLKPPAYRCAVRVADGAQEVVGEVRTTNSSRSPWCYSWRSPIANAMPAPRRCYSLAGARKAMDTDWHANYRAAIQALVRMRFEAALHGTDLTEL